MEYVTELFNGHFDSQRPANNRWSDCRKCCSPEACCSWEHQGYLLSISGQTILPAELENTTSLQMLFNLSKHVVQQWKNKALRLPRRKMWSSSTTLNSQCTFTWTGRRPNSSDGWTWSLVAQTRCWTSSGASMWCLHQKPLSRKSNIANNDMTLSSVAWWGSYRGAWLCQKQFHHFRKCANNGTHHIWLQEEFETCVQANSIVRWEKNSTLQLCKKRLSKFEKISFKQKETLLFLLFYWRHIKWSYILCQCCFIFFVSCEKSSFSSLLYLLNFVK